MSGTTTFDTVNKAANVTLSGSNLIATLSSTTQGGARSTRQIDHPIYVEFTCTLVGTVYRLGLQDNVFSATGSTVLGIDTHGVAINAADGTVKINNVTIGTAVLFTTAGTIDMAYHPQLRLIWFRINNGNWNNNVAFNPASATVLDSQGGFSTATLAAGGGGVLYPAFSSGGTLNAAATAKFSTAFTRTAPSGFTSVDADPGSIGYSPNPAQTTPNYVGASRQDPVAAFEQKTAFGTAAGAWYGISANTPNTRIEPWSPGPGLPISTTHASGIVTVAGAFAAKKVRLYDQATGDFIGETTSLLADGTWSIHAAGHTSVYAVCLDDTGTYNSLVFDLVVPL